LSVDPIRLIFQILHRPTGGVPLLTAIAAVAITITVAGQRRAFGGGQWIHGGYL